MKKLLVVMAVALVCGVAGDAQAIGLGVEVGKDTYLSLMFPMEGLTLQVLLDADRESNGHDDDIIEVGGALYIPMTELGDAELDWFAQIMTEHITDYDAGLKVNLGLAPRVMINENIGLGGKLSIAYEEEATPEGEDADTKVGFEGAINVHWFF